MESIFLALINLLQVYADDNLPSQVCKGCMDEVNNFSNFKVQCENSYAKLKHCLIQQQEDHDTKEVNINCVTSCSIKGTA